MNKWNKRIILLLILALAMGILVGCSDGTKLPEGIESKSFLKDIDKISDLALKSMSEQKYYEDEINDMLNDMTTKEYKDDLNDYEVLILESLTETIKKVKEDLTTGEKTIQSTTLEEIKIIREMIKN